MDQRLSTPGLTPLQEPPSATQSSCRDQAFGSVPVLRNLFAAAARVRRRRLRARHIAAQIAARRMWTAAVWGDDPKRRGVAAIVCDAIRVLFGWPNAHFVPDDPLSILMRDWCDELETSGGDDQLAGRLGLGPGRIKPSQMTLGQLVDLILQSPRRCRKCGYDLRASPERCPECGMPAGPGGHAS